MKEILMSFVAALVAFCSSAQDVQSNSVPVIMIGEFDPVKNVSITPWITTNSFNSALPPITISIDLTLEQWRCYVRMQEQGLIGETNQNVFDVVSNRLRNAAKSLSDSDFARFGQREAPKAVAEITAAASAVDETSLPALAAVVTRWRMLTPAARSNILQRISQ